VIAILGYGALALLCLVVLVAGLLWWDFCVWRRENGARLSRRHNWTTAEVTRDNGEGAL
jgi:hypothetical protein